MTRSANDIGDLPGFETAGWLPAFRVDSEAIDGRSPYRTSLQEFCGRFGRTAERRAFLGAFLQLRARLREAGVAGFHWIGGSFVENIESRRSRAPRDLDVVSFVMPPTPLTDPIERREFMMDLVRRFPAGPGKTIPGLDAYLVDLGLVARPWLIRQAVYWESLLGHTRQLTWKGIVELPLERGANDDEARSMLSDPLP